MNEVIQFGSKTISFRLEYSVRKTLGITVTPEMEVLVKAPIESTIEKIKDKIRKKAPWIIKQQSFFLTFQPKTPYRKYINGETHLYMGRQYRLKVISDNLKEKSEKVKLIGQFLEVNTSDINNTKVLVEAWFFEKAKEKITPLAQQLFDNFILKHNLSFLTFNFSLQNMPLRWGSCTPKGKIILNPELIKAPKGCIEYVIIHELCHLVHHDHTQKFMDLQTKEMKDWEKWKMKLEKLLA